MRAPVTRKQYGLEASGARYYAVPIEILAEHLNYTPPAKDSDLFREFERLGLAATQAVENLMGREVLPTRRDWVLDEFPCGDIILPAPNVMEVEDIRSTRGAVAVETAVSDSFVASFAATKLSPTAITPPPDGWVAADKGSIRITYVAGMASLVDSPAPDAAVFEMQVAEAVQQAIMMQAAYLHSWRGDVAVEPPAAIENLVRPYEFWFPNGKNS